MFLIKNKIDSIIFRRLNKYTQNKKTNKIKLKAHLNKIFDQEQLKSTKILENEIKI